MADRKQARQADMARTMEDYMRQRAARTPAAAAAPAAPTRPATTRHKLYLATGNEHCTKAFEYVNKTYTSTDGLVVTKKAAFAAAVEVINVTTHPQLQPPGLRGVPCFLEFSPKTGQWRPHYGTAAINAMAFLASTLPRDEATAADPCTVGCYSDRAGFAIDYTYEFEGSNPEQRAPRDLDSLQQARAARDQSMQRRNPGGAAAVDFTERDDAPPARGMSIDDMQRARMRPPALHG